MDSPELIFPYEVMGSPNAPPPESDTSSNSEFEAAHATSVVTITHIPPTGRKFPGSTHIVGKPSFAAHVSYHPEELVPKALVQSRDREGRRCLDILEFYLGIVEWNGDKVEHKVVTLKDRILELEQDGVRKENKRLRKKLESAEVSVTLARIDRDRVERDLYHLRVCAYGFYRDMIRSGVVEERPNKAINVLAIFGETQPPEP
ncbi:hypothetical protein Tco_1376143 [Tanacetum coccineum]